jgi:hypothetical protein
MFGLDPDATLRLLIGSLVKSFPGWYVSTPSGFAGRHLIRPSLKVCCLDELKELLSFERRLR